MAAEKVQKERLDILLTKSGLAKSREQAQSLILARRVFSGDTLLDKAGMKIPVDTPIRIKGEVSHYVSRGALKLKGALDQFALSLKGAICLDVGASTGGFTQVCLEYGAEKVYALDVGHNQLDWLLRSNDKVIVIENTHIKDANHQQIPQNIEFCCVDCSFISLKKVLPHLEKFLKAGASIVALIKPQHEVGRENVGKGGIVRDSELHQKVCDDMKCFFQSAGYETIGIIPSPILGTTGNKEYLIYAKKLQCNG